MNAYGQTATSYGEVAVGNTDHNRQITHVAAGSEDYDAVNVLQLKGAMDTLSAGDLHYYSVKDGGAQKGNYDNDGATADDALAAGVDAEANGKSSIAIGQGATANISTNIAETGGIAIGGEVLNNPEDPGQSSEAIGSDSVAIGSGAVADAGPGGQAALALGMEARATGMNAIAIGAQATTEDGTAVGAAASALHGGLAVGMHADAGPGVALVPGFTFNNSVALGKSAQVTSGQWNVALGGSSVAGNSDLDETSNPAYDPSGQGNIAGLTPMGEVSVGDAGAADGFQYRRITNVAAGADDTDAVNVSQLKATQTHYYDVNDSSGQKSNYDNDGAKGDYSVAAGPQVSTTGKESTAIGFMAGDVWDSTSSPTAVTTPSGAFSVSVGAKAQATGKWATATGYDSAASGELSSAFGRQANAGGYDNNEQATALGANAWAAGANSTAVGYGSFVTEDSGTALGANAYAFGANDVALGADSTVDSSAGINGAAGDYTISGNGAAGLNGDHTAAVSVGGTGAVTGETTYRQIQNVAPGVLSADSTDAVNGSQLWATNQVVGDLDDFAVKYDKDGNDDPDHTSVTLAGPTSTDGGKTGGTTITNLHQGDVSSTSTDAVNGSQLYDVQQTANAGWNLGVEGNTSPAQVKPGDNVDFSGDGNIKLTQTDTTGQHDITLSLGAWALERNQRQ